MLKFIKLKNPKKEKKINRNINQGKKYYRNNTLNFLKDYNDDENNKESISLRFLT